MGDSVQKNTVSPEQIRTKLQNKYTEDTKGQAVLNLTMFSIENGVKMKKGSAPKKHGASVRYLICPFSIMCSDSNVYSYALDVLFPVEQRTDYSVQHEMAKALMKVLLERKNSRLSPKKSSIFCTPSK